MVLSELSELVELNRRTPKIGGRQKSEEKSFFDFALTQVYYRVLSPYTPGQILFGNKAFIVCCGHFNVEKWAILRKCITLQSAFGLEKFLGFVYI